MENVQAEGNPGILDLFAIFKLFITILVVDNLLIRQEIAQWTQDAMTC